METHQYWTVPRHIQRTTTPSSQRSGGCSKIIAERELSWSGQHYRRTGPSRWKGCNIALTTICNKIWQTGEWPTPWTQSLVITLPKKSNLQQCQTYRTISLISHPSSHAEDHTEQIEAASGIIAEEKAGFRAGRSTTEQTFNLRILCEQYLQHQQDLYHVFIDFKQAFDGVWHAALWATMKKYNINANLNRVIKTSMTRPLV